MAANAARETIAIDIRDPVYYLDEDVTYAQADAWFGHVTRDLRMDIIYPQTDEKRYPCIVWICGGGWLQMSRSAHLPYLTDLARRGFAVASVDYRLGHEAPFPGAVIDIKAAIRYLRAHAKRYSINTEKFGVSGESAGGYLAAMIALTRGSEFEAGEYLDYSSAVQAACPWYMPCDLAKLADENTLRPAFFSGDINDGQYRRFINPLSYITPDAPPFLILHGTEDTLVPFEHGEMIYEALIAQKIDARLVGLRGEEHAGPQFFQRPLWDIIAEFFKEKLE
ncbi:MAG: alpha/beta hydrolase [Treponema sp.]|jgi:acetyl esterase/lipase|nr:alpha/beta hydrolase [Treponema sp.]